MIITVGSISCHPIGSMQKLTSKSQLNCVCSEVICLFATCFHLALCAPPSLHHLPFLPQSWKWKITLNERKLMLAGPYHGRKGNGDFDEFWILEAGRDSSRSRIAGHVLVNIIYELINNLPSFHVSSGTAMLNGSHIFVPWSRSSCHLFCKDKRCSGATNKTPQLKKNLSASLPSLKLT